jgi:hypothetical protein
MIRRKLLGLLTIISLAALPGCEKKSTPAAEASAASAQAEAPASSEAPWSDATVRLHWLGIRRIAADQKAAGLKRVWDTPESVRLKAQTLDKLSSALGRLLTGQTNQAGGNSLRPLLDDLVSQECYLEIRQASNAPSASDEIVLAVALNAERAHQWQTDLAAVTESRGTPPPSNSYSGSIEFVRTNDWTVVAAARGHNSLLDEIVGRIQRNRTPVISSSTNALIEGSIDLSRFVFGTKSNTTLPKVSFAMKGDGTSVITTGEFVFPESEPLKFASWNLPTNLIPNELASFTAVRGLQSSLADSRFWMQLQAGSSPDQIYVWAVQGSPMRTYFAIPLADASNVVGRLSELALKKEGPRRLINALAGFRRSKTSNGLSWKGFPYIVPFIESWHTNDLNFVFGGFIQGDLLPGPPPKGLPEYLRSHTNLVYYDREITGLRIEQWIHLGQAIRYVSGTAQLPADAASLLWLRAMAGSTTNCATEITMKSPTRLSFARRSDAGFSAFELHLLADWLESPDFPRGTYSLLEVSPQPPVAP